MILSENIIYRQKMNEINQTWYRKNRLTLRFVLDGIYPVFFCINHCNLYT